MSASSERACFQTTTTPMSLPFTEAPTLLSASMAVWREAKRLPLPWLSHTSSPEYEQNWQAITHLFAHVDCCPGNIILYTPIQMDWKRKKYHYMIVFIQSLYVYFGSLLCIRTYRYAINCCLLFYQYYIRGGEASSVPFTLYVCLPYINGEDLALSVDDSSSQHLEVEWILFITSKRHFPNEIMCAWYFYWEECLFTLNFCRYQSRTRHFPSSVSTLYHCMVRVTRAPVCFLALWWDGVCLWFLLAGPFPCMWEMRPSVRNRDNTQVITNLIHSRGH